MSKLLYIDSSILGGNSVSRQLTAQIAASWRAAHPATDINYLDLAVDTPSVVLHAIRHIKPRLFVHDRVANPRNSGTIAVVCALS